VLCTLNLVINYWAAKQRGIVLPPLLVRPKPIYKTRNPLTVSQCLVLDTFALLLTIMSKRTSPASSPSSTKKPNTGSSAKKSVIQELLISRDTPAFGDAIISSMFGISVALGAISRSQEVMLDKIESIALKVEILQKEVKSMKEELSPVQETPSPTASWLPSNEELREFLNSPLSSPERTCFPDLTCYETPYLSSLPSIDLTFPSDGSTDLLEWENLDWPTSLSPTPTSKNQEQNGGMDTYVKRK